MLRTIVNLFNFIGGLLNAFFIFSYSIGKVMFYISYQTIKLLLSLFSSIGNNVWMLLEEFHYFWMDLSNSVNRFSISVSEGASETMENLRYGAAAMKDKAIMYASRKLGLTDLGDDVLYSLKYLSDILVGAISLLSDILWFVIMILPNTVLFFGSLLLACLWTILGTITLIYTTFRSIIFESYAMIVNRVRDQPVRTFLEVAVLIVFYSNSAMMARFAQIFSRFAYRKAKLLFRKAIIFLRRFYNEYLEMRTTRFQSTRQEMRPTGSVAPLHEAPFDGVENNREIQQIRSPVHNHKEEDSYDATLCVVCFERQRCIVLFPCKHCCLCDECSNSLPIYQNTCPLCRVLIRSQLKIHL